jgi:hypothetical protein
MMASTCTWARRMSSLSITAIRDFMILGGAVMMSALVGDIRPDGHAGIDIGGAAAAAGAVAGPPWALAEAVAWPLSLSAIFSASA